MKTSREVKHAHIVCWVCLANVSSLIRCPARLKCSLLSQRTMNSAAMSQIPDMMNVHSHSRKCIMPLQNIKDEKKMSRNERPRDIKTRIYYFLVFISSLNLSLKKV